MSVIHRNRLNQGHKSSIKCEIWPDYYTNSVWNSALFLWNTNRIFQRGLNNFKQNCSYSTILEEYLCVCVCVCASYLVIWYAIPVSTTGWCTASFCSYFFQSIKIKRGCFILLFVLSHKYLYCVRNTLVFNNHSPKMWTLNVCCCRLCEVPLLIAVVL